MKQSAVTKPSLLTLEQAVALFAELADIEAFAFSYIEEACDARAHLMCKAIDSKDVTPQKAWMIVDDLMDDMLVHCPDGRKTTWGWHVAASVPVITPEDVQDVIFDPGLFDGPVTVKEWASAVKFPHARVKITPLGIAPEEGFSDYTSSSKKWTTPETDGLAHRALEKYCRDQKENPGLRGVFASSSRKQVFTMKDQPVCVQGKTWRTAGNAKTHYMRER